MAQASGKSAGKSFFGKFGVHLAVLVFVVIWTVPTLGILVTSLAATVWRKSLFSLTAGELHMVFWAHMARILATTLISATLWFMVLPDTPIGWWLVLAAVRLLISRLPFVPNKDVVFAGVAVLAAGANLHIAELMAMMAGLILSAHLIAGLAFALIDLTTGERRLAFAR